MGKRVLVISYVALMSTMPNGRTMQSLLHGVDAEDISLVFTYGKPDKGSCRSAYCLSNTDVLHSVFSFNNAGYEYSFSENNNDAIQTKKAVTKNSKNYFFREAVWSLGKWRNKLLKWAIQQKPDYILYMYGDTPAYLKMARFLAKNLNIPLILYTCEDYYFKDFNYIDGKNNSLFFRSYHRCSVKNTKKLFKYVRALIANTDLLAETYKDEFGVSFTRTITMASRMKFKENTKITDFSNVNISYLGAIAKYRKDALKDVAYALSLIDSSYVLNVYGKIEDDAFLKEFNSCPNLNYRGFVSYEEVKNIMHTTNLLLEVLNIDPYIEKDNRFGFSTKYADCFACGTPLLIYAPESVVEMQFAINNNCAFYARNQEELVVALKEALLDEEKRKQQIERARIITDLYFNEDTNILKFNETVNYVLNKT